MPIAHLRRVRGLVRPAFAMPSALHITFVLMAALLSGRDASAQGTRFFEPTVGYLRAKDLPDDFVATVGTVDLSIKDAFEGSTAHSDEERWLFDIGNKLHIKSKPSTIRRRLLFAEGDTVTKGILLETEKTLRAEEFLADAIIEVKPLGEGKVDVKVTTYDQWTTVPGVSLQREGRTWIYWLGPVESNLLGTGQRLGLFYGHDQFRDTYWLDYNNNALTYQRLHLTSHLASLSDGYDVLISLSKPLETRTSKYAFTISESSQQLSEGYYFDANKLDQLPDSLARAKSKEGRELTLFRHADTHDFDVSVTRSFGYHTKFNVSPSFDRHDRYNYGTIGYVIAEKPILDDLPPPPSAYRLDERLDYLLGVSMSIYQYDYKTVQNFNNLKWSETLETGWRLTTKVAKNQEWMGARGSEWQFTHAAVYNDAWWDQLFFNSSGTLKYYLSDAGDFDDGSASAFGEIQWKPVTITSTYLAATWNNLFATAQSQQLLLGEDSGLNGYPNFYYAGQARILLEAEQRFFPSFEAGTLVPALAVFVDAGNTFPGYSQFDPANLHYSAGFGLRFGLTKSVQKLVNHVNFSWPIDEKYLSGYWPTISVIAKKTL